MGMDIYSSSGVVLTLEDALASILRKAKKADVKRIVAAINERWKSDDKKGVGEVEDRDGLVSWLCSFAEGLVDKESEYMDSIALEDVFQIIIETLRMSLPAYSFDYWTRGRINGWEVPLETPCIVFGSEGLFEKKMTREGKRLASVLGRSEVKESTWTVMSV